METQKIIIFQFQYGAIKSLEIVGPDIPVSHFNSSMVRLKEWRLNTWYNAKLLFQFQYGAIKSLRMLNY